MPQPSIDVVSTKVTISVASDSLTHTAVLGAKGAAVLFVHRAAGSGPSPPVPTATYDGVAMTQISTVTQNSGAGLWSSITAFFILKPPTGAKVVAWTSSGAIFYNAMGVITYNDVLSIRTAGTNFGTSGTSTLAPADVAIDELFTAGHTNQNSAWNSSGGQTNHYDLDTAIASYKTGVGSVTQTWTGASVGWVANGALVKGAGRGNQMNWFFSRIQDFYRDLRAGLLPPHELRRRYGDLMAI